MDSAQGEGVADTSEGLHCLGRHGIYQVHGVAQYFRQRTAMMEMESLVWGRCYCSVLMLHFSSQDLYIRRNLRSHDYLQFSCDGSKCRNLFTLSQYLFTYIGNLYTYIVSVTYIQHKAKL